MKKDKPGYWGILPASVRYDDRLKPNAKIMYAEISALASKEGYCSASNNYFADLYGVAPETVSRWISQLDKCGHVSARIIRNELGQIVERMIFPVMNTKEQIESLLTKKSIPYCQNDQYPIDEMIKGNNTSINNTHTQERETEKLDPNDPGLFSKVAKLLADYLNENPDQWEAMKAASGYTGKPEQIAMEWAGKQDPYTLVNWERNVGKLVAWMKVAKNGRHAISNRPQPAPEEPIYRRKGVRIKNY